MREGYLASIIISSYNYGRFLPQAIDSALSQTYPYTEVIVVDDGSTDSSREIISGYGKRIIPVLKENGGQASAFNAGFRVSRGDVIFFLDSDDMLLPTAVQQVIPLFDAAVIKVHWPLWEVDDQGRKTGRHLPSHAPIDGLPEGDLREVVMQGGPASYAWPPTSGNAWARGFLERILPMPEDEYRVAPDLYLCALAPVLGPIKGFEEPLGCWRTHGKNNSYHEAFDERLKLELRRWDHCLDVLSNYFREMGINVDVERWKANAWCYRINLPIQEIVALVPQGDAFILVDQEEWGTDAVVAGRQRIPFLERDGQYWGLPSDDATAIWEVERLRQAGANFMVFGWPAFWWLDHYSGLHHHLRSTARCSLANDRVIVFDLRPEKSDCDKLEEPDLVVASNSLAE